MKRIVTYNGTLNERQLAEICSSLADGNIIIYPTDTLYAIGCDALLPKVVDRLCRINGINPTKTSLSIVCHNISQAAEYVRIDNSAFRILKELTPGPCTFLLKALTGLPKVLRGRGSVGIRIPDNNVARQIAEQLGHPLLNISLEHDDSDYFCNPDLIGDEYSHLVDILINSGESGTMISEIIDLIKN